MQHVWLRHVEGAQELRKAESSTGVVFAALCQKTQSTYPCRIMSPAEDYRKKAAEFRALAKAAQGTALAVQLDQLARSYVRLAEQADANARTDIAVETGKKTADGS